MSHEAIIEQLRRRVSADEYRQIRQEWKTHSIAEDQRDIAGLLSTLTDDCVYELAQTGEKWHGHEGAARFYTELLTAFPDIHFDLQNIVIGPQGVFEEAHVTGTHKGQWLHYPATGREIEFDVIILFPWDPEKKKFGGERVYVFGLQEAVGM
ncbi:MAG: nuclear transport factor 2 family protein [Chloroflexi bacterium]|nr:nuclear transport factor 2 family protein [Chloroflexota bacterium]MCI0577714.1 nuclear transport factor 2 family protein [Chloroflexota bacterium]MCI0649797.1 nuclear transport factor 2 family protein [Chloroflexota bacterium]MCI0730506.1 nuclear transport factor 2 family protein [Chloroflexota bacterium]